MARKRKPQPLEPPTCDDHLLWDIQASAFHFPALTVADELGLFPLLDKKPATAFEVASSLSLGTRATDALLGVLTALGFLVQHQDTFSNTEVASNFLLPDSPYYWGGFLRARRDRIPTHASVREAILNDTLRDNSVNWLGGGFDAVRAKEFTAMMHSKSFPGAVGVARLGDFSGVNRLLDVAGGSGCFCIALAMRHPHMRFTVLELSSVCDLAKQYIADYGLQDQIDTCVADMFNDLWPSGYDAVFFSDIFHDWEPDRCLQLARRAYEMLPSGGRIYLHEALLADTKDGPLTAITYSLRMLLATQGKQFTARELAALLSECGFEQIHITPTSTYFSLISARKP